MVAVPLKENSIRPRFALGQVVATPGALEALAASGQAPSEFLNAQVQGDWGSVSDADKVANEEALATGLACSRPTRHGRASGSGLSRKPPTKRASVRPRRSCCPTNTDLRGGHHSAGNPHRRPPIKTIEIIVSPAGQTRIETRGFSGSECQKASEFIEQALGPPQSEQLTPEFYQTMSTAQPGP